MKLPSCKISLRKSKNCVKSFIASALFLSLAYLPFSASASVSSNTVERIKEDVSDIAGDMDLVQQSMQGVQNAVEDQRQDIERTAIAIEAVLHQLGGSYTLVPNYTDRDNLLYYQRILTYFLLGTDRPNVNAVNSRTVPTLPKILSTMQSQMNLNSNPFWYTNTNFSAWNASFSSPNRPAGVSLTSLTLPQLLSFWSEEFTAGQNVKDVTPSDSNWLDYWGRGMNHAQRENWSAYSFFDFLADVAKTNLMLQSAILAAIPSNAPVASLPAFTNIVNVAGDTNIFNAVDILAGNPWWYTNSSFSLARGGQIYPVDYVNSSPFVSGSFEEVLSWFMMLRNAGPSEISSREDLWNHWGFDSSNRRTMGDYAFEDFLADWLKSNIVMVAGSSNETAQMEYDAEETIASNSLPEYVLQKPTASDFGWRSAVSGSMEGILDAVKPGTGSSDAEIVVIPAFSVGGVSVDEYRANLEYAPVVQVANGVMRFIWSVLMATGMIVLASKEWAYWSTLGKTAYH